MDRRLVRWSSGIVRCGAGPVTEVDEFDLTEMANEIDAIERRIKELLA